MGLSGCGKFLKYSMFLFNAVILIAGCGLLGFGVYIRTTPTNRLRELSSIMGSNYYGFTTYAFIISGGVVIILSFFGCCGAIKEVKCMLGTFFFMLFVMLVSMIVGGVLAYVYRDSIGENIIQKMNGTLNTEYGSGTNNDITQAWDLLQEHFKCCGVQGDVNSTTSWMHYRTNSEWFKLNEQDDQHIDKPSGNPSYLAYVPVSCCKKQADKNYTKCQGGPSFNNIIPALNTTEVSENMENDQLYTDGCYNSVIDFLEEHIIMLAGLVAGIAVLMIMGMVFSICLCRRIEDEFIFD